MSQRPRAEAPTILSEQIQAAIDSYPNIQIGPSLASYISDQLLAWFATYPAWCRGGGDGGTPLRRGGGEGGTPLGGAEGPSPWNTFGEGPGACYGGDGPNPLVVSPMTDEALKAGKLELKSESPFDPNEKPVETDCKEFVWNHELAIEHCGHIYARIIKMRLRIWETGEWTLWVAFRSWARVRIKVSIALCDKHSHRLCVITTDWKTLSDSSGAIDGVVYGGHSACVSEFYTIIDHAYRSVKAFG